MLLKFLFSGTMIINMHGEFFLCFSLRRKSKIVNQFILMFVTIVSLYHNTFTILFLMAMNSQWNNDFMSMSNSAATTRLIYDFAGGSTQGNFDSTYASVNNMQILLSSTRNTGSNMDDDEAKEQEELDHQRFVFVLFTTSSLMQKHKIIIVAQ